MEKVAEYDSKKMNLELAPTVAEMPSSMRAMFADQKFLNTENKIKEYNGITNKLASQFEGILKSKLNLPGLTAMADAIAASGILFSDRNSQSTGSVDLSGASDISGIGGGVGAVIGGGVSGVIGGDDNQSKMVLVPLTDIFTDLASRCHDEIIGEENASI